MIERVLRQLALPLLLLTASPVISGGTPLAEHPSPYLRDHAGDLVNWLPGDSDINATARKSGKLIFLSSGYQSCYWCYRMKRDSFNDAPTANLINEAFIPVIVDRELSPQLDAEMQQIMEALRGIGGWPANLLLTPDGLPVAAFSYANPANLRKTLTAVQTRWNREPDALEAIGKAHLDRLRDRRDAAEGLLTDAHLGDLLQAFLLQTSAAADTRYGGFGDEEKYPNLPQLLALQRLTAIMPDETLTAFLKTTLDAMLQNGLRDHVGGGLFRYTTDRQWRSPHFEKMLYTQAQAARLLLLAGEQFDEKRYTGAGRELLQMLLKDFRREDGLFRSALSAVGRDGRNGGHYLWQSSELERLLGNDWRDKVDILVRTEAGDILPGLTPDVSDKERAVMLRQRDRKDPPGDDKALLGLNGLVLSALALGHEDPAIARAGKALAEALNKAADTASPKQLPDADNSDAARLEDLVYAASGLYDWSVASGDGRSRQQAASLLRLAHRNHHASPHWLGGALAPLPGNSRSLLPQDTQLPSPAALWIDTAWRLAESGEAVDLGRFADTASLVWPQSLRDNTFFHATWLATMIERRVRLRSQEKRTR